MFAGGFKIPQEVIDKQAKRKKELPASIDNEAKDFEEQKERILNDLKLSPPGAYRDKKQPTYAENKGDLAKIIVKNLEKEVDRLKRQSETLKLSRAIAASEVEIKKDKLKSKEKNEFKKDLEYERGDLIHLSSARVQLIKSRPDILLPDNMSYEDLEELKVIIHI